MVTVVVIFGAIAHATSQWQVAKDTGAKFTKLDYFARFVIATFSGGVFGMASKLFFQNPDAVILFSAIGAFLGMTGLNTLSLAGLEFLTNRLNKRK